MKYIAIASALLVAACGSMPEVRPHAMPETVATTPFDDAYRTGKEHLMAGRVGLAIVYFEKALVYDPLSVAALNGIGTAYDDLHRPEVAKMYYIKALAIEPNSSDTLNNMAVSAALAGDNERAADFFARAVKLDPGNTVIHENLQVAGLAPKADDSRDPTITAEALAAIDENRPRIERTGVAEFTLTLPASTVQVTALE